jgi:hypothetical protein
MDHQEACQIRDEITDDKEVHKEPFMNGHQQAQCFGHKPSKSISQGEIDDQIIPPRERGEQEPNRTKDTPQE